MTALAQLQLPQPLDLDQLTDPQCEAVVEALVATACSDGVLSEAEAGQLDRELLALPWTWRKDSSEKLALVKRSRERVGAALADPDAALELVESIGARLTGTSVRETVYAMCLAVELADREVSAGERSVVGGLRLAFGISETRAEELAAKTREALG